MSVVEINTPDDNKVKELINDISEGSNKHVFIMVHAHWCGHCKEALPVWKTIKSSSPNVKLYAVEETAMKNVQDLAIKLKVEGYPEFKYIKNGKNMNSEPTKRDVQELAKWIQQADKMQQGGKRNGCGCPTLSELFIGGSKLKKCKRCGKLQLKRKNTRKRGKKTKSARKKRDQTRRRKRIH
jgi:thiol-disulfide isomerase/thioredoxin